MPKSKSVLKRLRQNLKRRMRNRAVKSEVKTYTKKLLSAIAESNKDKAEELLKVVYKKYDMAVSKGIIHWKTAARKKSRLAKKLQAMA